MNLTDIKNIIIEQLSNLTIDDYYADPNISYLVKKTFAEVTKLNSPEEIENYLTQKFSEVTIEAKCFNLKKSINDLNDQISNIQESSNNDQGKIDMLIMQIAEEEEKKQTTIPNQLSLANNHLKEIQMEIQLLEPLASKFPYLSHLKDLEEREKKINVEIKNYLIQIDKSKKEIDGLQSEINKIRESIVNYEVEIDTFNTTILKTQKELDKINENRYYENEYLSLEFLFKILLKTSINKNRIFEKQKTGKIITDRYSNKEIEETISVATGEISLNKMSISNDDYSKFILSSSLVINKNIIPNEWRKILYETFTKPLPNFSGTIGNLVYKNEVFFTSQSLELTSEDISTILAIKIAVKTNEIVTTIDNKIILGLSGGLAATIIFREKGDVITRFQKQEFEIYSNCFKSDRFKQNTLYYQNGYADSRVCLQTPGAFYLLANKYVIEIYLDPAPILFDSNNIVKFSPNISGIAKYEDKQDEDY